MIPHKNAYYGTQFDIQLADVIDTDIDMAQEDRQEPEQMWLKMEKEIDEQEDRANDYD